MMGQKSAIYSTDDWLMEKPLGEKSTLQKLLERIFSA